jgi:hypothetical protein
MGGVAVSNEQREPAPGAAVFTIAQVGKSITIASSGWPAGMAGLRLLRSALHAALGWVESEIDRELAAREQELAVGPMSPEWEALKGQRLEHVGEPVQQEGKGDPGVLVGQDQQADDGHLQNSEKTAAHHGRIIAQRETRSKRG